MADIQVRQEGRVLVLTVDRPQARNALAGSTMQELDAHLADLADRTDIHCAVITGAGERAFIAGGDLKELESHETRPSRGRWPKRCGPRWTGSRPCPSR